MKKKKEIVRYDAERAKSIVMSVLSFEGNKDALLKELSEEIIPVCSSKNEEEKEGALKKFSSKSMDLLRIIESESHVGLMEAFNVGYRGLSADMTKTLIREFGCSNEAEKALAELAVNAYIRVIDNSRRLNNEFEATSITPNRNVYIANLSKQVDRAHRQFISSILTLKQLKSPQIEMSIKANTAFVSNNQQVNVSKNETITPQ
jgi:hypothetical protein